MLEKFEGTLKSGQFRETGNIGHTKQDDDKQYKKTQKAKTYVPTFSLKFRSQIENQMSDDRFL